METKIIKRDLKKGINGDDSRRRREEKSIALRKDKKEEGLSKKRNIVTTQFTEAEAPVSTTDQLPQNLAKSFTQADIPTLFEGLQSTVVDVQITCLRGFRKLLSIEQNPPVQQCIDCGAVPHFVNFLQRHDNHTLQFEAAWALTNIASTDRTQVVVESGALPLLVQLLQCPNPDIREQCAWCLGNIAGDGPHFRDIVLSLNALPVLVANITQAANISLLRNCTWALSNFCRGKPQPSLEVLLPALPVLANIVIQNVDQDTMIDAIWALSYVSDGDNTRIQQVVNTGVVPALVKLLQSNKNQLIVPALRTLGNIVSGDDGQTQSVIAAGGVTAIVPLLQNSKKNIRKEACWTLSNIAAGSPEQITQLISTPEMLTRVLQQMSTSAEWDVRKEASWVVSNIATGGQKSHLAFLVEHGAIRPLCDLLDVGDFKMLMLAMEALEALLKTFADSDRVSRLIDEAGGVDKLEQLQEHENEGVYAKAVKILEKYFGGEEEQDAENTPAVSQNGSTFQFGAPMGNQQNATVFSFGAPQGTTKQQAFANPATPVFSFNSGAFPSI